MALARRLGRKSASQSLDEQLAQLQKVYELITPNEVLKVIHYKPRLVKLLLDGRRKLEKYLPGSRFTIERDSDIEDFGDASLIVTVYPPETMSEVKQRIGDFQDDWFIKNNSQINDDFSIRYEHHSLGKVWDWLQKFVGIVDMPEDWSAETDHYLHGTPKRHNKDLGKDKAENVEATNQSQK
jgi:hypothetical protein